MSIFWRIIKNEYAIWGILAGVTIISGVICFFILDYMVLVCINLIGSFMIVHGVSVYVGYFPNPFSIVTLSKYGLYEGLDPKFYIYIGVIIISTVVSSVI